ncbi:uncharacterized protein LOC119616974 [Kryptolebias marmoratus]|uniref:uncharacterized protein LOC119616974 n=1 Tax=Kryptolebias marmoratus TaxID=37003 RepID=UPI0018ACE83E|nr:uncharacterized protein LOC119616974 [Kryptolebias marmoratus]
MELQNRTRVQQTEEQLYSISSSLMVSDRDPDLIYSCTVRTQRNQRNQRNQRRATVRKQNSTISSDRQTTISCSASNSSVRSFIWRFNHGQVIVNRSRALTVAEEWKHQVKEVSDSGSLTLQDLSSQHEGVYTCERSDEEETFITNIFLRTEDESEGGKRLRWLLVPACVALLGRKEAPMRGKAAKPNRLTAEEVKLFVPRTLQQICTR